MVQRYLLYMANMTDDLGRLSMGECAQGVRVGKHCARGSPR